MRREIIDESDVFIDVHKATRRPTQAPRNRLPKAKIVTNSVDNAADGEEDLIKLDDEQQATHPVIRRLASTDGKSKSSAVELGTSPRTVPIPRRTSSIAAISDKDSAAKRGDTPEMREHLKHLGPSNLASRPRQTRYNTVKIKPGAGTMASLTTKKDETAETSKTLSIPTASQGGVGEGLLKSAGQDAKDGVHAVQVGYGSMDSPPRTPKSLENSKGFTINGNSKGPDTGRQDSARSQSTIGSLPDRDEGRPRSPLVKRSVRSGSITENIIEAGGVTKVVLEMTSSSEENDKGAEGSDHDGKDECKPNSEGQEKSGRKKRRRKRKKTGEDTALLEEDEEEE